MLALECAGFIALILLAFLGLAIVCDDYLCPAIDIICERLKIPDDVAGASFLALGSAAPEIAISAVATAKITGAAGASETGFSLPTIFGSAMIAFGLIPAACTFYIKPGESWMKLTTWPVVRDTVYYLICLGYCVYAVSDGQVVTEESAILCLLFAVYMLVVYLPAKCCGFGVKDEEDEEQTSLTDNLIMTELENDKQLNADSSRRRSSRAIAKELKVGDDAATKYGTASINAPSPQSDEDEEEADGCVGALGCALSLLVRPFEMGLNLVFSFTIPDCQKPGMEKWYMLTFLISTVYVVVLSDLVLQWTQFCTNAFGMSPAIAGSTVLALGAQVPDTIASMSMARSDMADGAVSNAVGSQVINVALGVGLPFLIYNCATGLPIATPAGDLVLLASCLLIVVGAYLILALAPVFIIGQAGIHKYGGYFLLVAFLGAYIYFIVTQAS